MSERIHGIYDLGRTGNKHKGDVIQRREQDECGFIHRLVSGSVRCGALREHHSQYTGHEFTEPEPINTKPIHDIVALLDRVSYADDLNDRVAARLELMKQHTTLVEQRDLLVGIAKDALRFRELNYGECGHDTLMVKVCSQCEIRAALATVEQGGKTR